jgi:hypothetical protein
MIGSFFPKLSKMDERDGLSPIQRFGANLDFLIHPNFRGGDTIRQQGARNLQQMKRNKSIEELQRRADQGDAVAARFLDGLNSGALDPAQAFSGYLNEVAANERFAKQQAAAASKTNAALQRATGQAKKVAEYLSSQGRDDLAQMVLASPELAGSVMGSLATETLKPKTAYTKEQISLMGSLRDDLRKDTETYKLVGEGYDRIMAFYNNPNAVTDYALAVAFAKILDPTSVAREGEVAAVANAGAKVPALGQALKNAITGEGTLTPTVRQQIAEAARGEYLNVVPKAQTTIAGYQAVAAKAGLTLDDIYMGPSFETPENIVPSVIPQSAIDAGLDQEDWNAMPISEKKAFT